jgi:hypothetical protein
VVVHARDTNCAAALTDLVDRGAALVVGDLASAPQTGHLADQVNQLGRMDPVIHNADVYSDRDRNPRPEGHPRVLAVDTLAPYVLRGLSRRPDRLIYLTSDMHVGGDDSLNDLDRTTRRWNGTRPTATHSARMAENGVSFGRGKRQIRGSAATDLPSRAFLGTAATARARRPRDGEP